MAARRKRGQKAWETPKYRAAYERHVREAQEELRRRRPTPRREVGDVCPRDKLWIENHKGHVLEHLEALVDSGLLSCLRGSELKVWIALWRHASYVDGGDCYPSNPTLEGQTGLAPSTVSAAKKRLRELHLMWTVEEGHPGEGGSGLSSHHELLLGDVDMLPDDAPVRRGIPVDEHLDNAVIKRLIALKLNPKSAFDLWTRIGGDATKNLVKIADGYAGQAQRTAFIRLCFNRSKPRQREGLIADLIDWKENPRRRPTRFPRRRPRKKR